MAKYCLYFVFKSNKLFSPHKLLSQFLTIFNVNLIQTINIVSFDPLNLPLFL